MPLDYDGPLTEQAILHMAQQPTTPAADGIGPWPYLALIGGNGADLATTLQAISSGRGKEGNPVMAKMGPAGIAAMKVGGTAGIALLMKHLAKEHPDLAKWIGYLNGGAMGALAVRNATVGR
jgi:hypothetical protein